jgi:hypothetical protein
VTCLYSLPELSTFYNRSIEPFVVPILLPLTQMALTGRKQLSQIKMALTVKIQLFHTDGV